MRILLALMLIINPISDLDKIARVNAAKKEAERAYLAENFDLAREKYLFLKDSLGVTDDKLMLNLANAQFHANDSASALSNYRNLSQSTDRSIASLANQQLGAMEFRSKKYQEALQYYKAALKSDPANEDARYNYELLKKLIKEQEEQEEQQQENKDQQEQNQEDQEQQDQEQQKQDQQNQDQQDQEQNEENQEEQQDQQQEEQKQDQQEEQQQEEQKPDDQEEQDKEDQSKPNPIDEEKLKEMKISEEKAMLILEAMKNNEIQYIQQNKRKAKKKKDPSKPDW